jgi:UDP:flavonoid glycosyltransferase YjiC (YdhE family)
MRQKAETLGKQIRQEDGVGNAVAIIEKVLKR